ncbi:MAG: polysaccharide biosynthesis/export family protein [Hyphomicrobiales bacterium]
MIKAGAASSLGYDEQKVNFDYVVVDITSSILEFLDNGGPASLYRSFGGGKGGAPEILVGVGDTVQVTIFESATGGLFVPADAGSRPGNYVTLPAQTVDRSGYVSVPYAGLVPAAGRSLPQIQQDIEARLENRAIEPQAVVALLSQKATEAAVVGEVNSPDKLAINPAGDRILDMISRAGGLKYAGHESFVTLQRRGKKATVYFNNLVQNPAENIYVAPGDTIYVYREQKSYLAFGATGMSGQFNFDTDKLSLAEAVGKAGGLLDARADPGQTFVYRLEERSALEKMGVDLAKFPADKTAIPTIYRANFRNPTSFFFSQKFQMLDKDVLYVSNADSVELIKFLTVVNSVSSTVSGVSSDALTTRNSIRGFKN